MTDSMAAALRRTARWTTREPTTYRQTPLPSARPTVPMRGVLATYVFSCLLGTYLAFAHVGEPSYLSATWMLQAAIVLTLAAFDHPTRSRGQLWRALGALAGLYLLGGLLAGQHLGTLLWMGVANAIGSVVGVRIYRHNPTRSWLPRDLREFLWLWTACAIAPLVTQLLGGFPQVTPWGGIPVERHLWSLLRQIAVLTTAVNCVAPVFFAAPEQVLKPLRARWWPPYAVLMVVCVLAPYAWPKLPLTWLVAIPAVVAGAVMRRRSAGLAVLALGVISMASPYPDYTAPALLGVLNPAAPLDAYVAFLSDITLLIVSFREQGASLVASLRAHAAAVGRHREVRDTVLGSMSDGLLLTDQQGRVLLSNGAITYLLGQLPPTVVTMDWARQVHLQAADVDRMLGAREFARLLRPRPGGLSRSGLVVPGGPAGERRLGVTTRDILVGQDSFTLWFFRDVTAAHAQERELEDFAGKVAHELNRPLVTLGTWMDTADCELAVDDAAAGRYAMDQAQVAIASMRALIDDYLAQAVGRGGVLTPTDVALAQVVREICTAYEAGGSAVFDVDVEHVVHADAALTRQLFANLIGAGVKNHRPGHLAYVLVRSADEAPGWAEVAVSDRGAGLPWSAQEGAGEGAGDNEGAGAGEDGVRRAPVPPYADPGLGLNVVNAIVARHGGQLTAESNEWGGATFRVTLPLAQRVESA